MSSKLICYELNEVPWRVVDFYISRRPHSNLSKFLKKSSHLTTVTSDGGELHPWTTWPTMHRGVDNSVHKIHYINQDRETAQAHPPLWEVLSNANKTVGVCGTLQSYPPIENDHVLFHVPDTFAPGPETHPKKYESFQALNLQLTSENKAVTSKIKPKTFIKASKMFFAGVKLSTGVKIFNHLLKEKMNPLNKSRRATMQSHLAFDVFMDCLKNEKPQYVSFFTNHVAGIMHRYWKYSFPEDFDYQLTKAPKDQFHKNSVVNAMDIFDTQLGELDQFCDKNGYDLVVASSMGQEAVEKEHKPELKFNDHKELAKAIGFKGQFLKRLAMQPDVAFEFSNESELKEFVQLVAKVVDPEGDQIFVLRYEPKGLSLNLSVASSQSAIREDTVLFEGQKYTLMDCGLESILRDVGTGYHQPEGILIWSGDSKPNLSGRQRVDSQQFAPTVLQALGVKRPSYMKECIA